MLGKPSGKREQVFYTEVWRDQRPFWRLSFGMLWHGAFGTRGPPISTMPKLTCDS